MARPLLPLFLYKSLNRRSEARLSGRLERLVAAGQLAPELRDARLAWSLPARPKGQLIWLHAATAPSVRPAMELFSRVAEDRAAVRGLVTVGSGNPVTSVDTPEDCVVGPAPEEDLAVIRRFLTHWDPDCLVWIGGRFRPLLIDAARERGVPCLSIDALKPALQLDTSTPFPGLRSAILRCFDHVFVANAEAAVPWRRAGLDPDAIDAVGFLEEGGMAPAYDEEVLERRRGEIGTRPIWFAAHVRSGEVGEVIRAHKRALRRAHRLLLVLSLADCADMPRVLEQFESANLSAALLDPETPIPEDLQVLLTHPGKRDGLWYRLAPVSFLGSSLTPSGGIDPYPAAAMGSAIIHGPHVADVAAAYDRLGKAKATRKVRDGYELGEEIDRLLAPDQAALLAAAAWNISSSGAEATDRVGAVIEEILDRREGGGT
ncbi:3-deoxy-D-manno-octulosonic acid transferase [Celeribacter indicus]|uniref:3-deoxy-D-manno-octulosonic acid transferase n=1 Tax=Celeribacter indicus TaxID=1208324 RepID=A0A0B5DWL5_9RHOB|nr:glycosyltransferase N-terminal domain-containing protein [Celeribacter indicus]AJE45106.1 three-deoxy-D-manno-octulosonic-acid transferase domain-containing protein [Celeribacter indicus]SDX27329.1 3-deoxy-D-manno-octulosonic-acid transferase [Celeribacter indicus]